MSASVCASGVLRLMLVVVEGLLGIYCIVDGRSCSIHDRSE